MYGVLNLTKMEIFHTYTCRITMTVTSIFSGDTVVRDIKSFMSPCPKAEL